MFDFLKSSSAITPVIVDQDEETGTYADAFLQVPDMQLRDEIREHGHYSHTRDYGAHRIVARGTLGFA